jgi:hypothetical protein
MGNMFIEIFRPRAEAIEKLKSLFLKYNLQPYAPDRDENQGCQSYQAAKNINGDCHSSPVARIQSSSSIKYQEKITDNKHKESLYKTILFNHNADIFLCTFSP